MRFPLPCTVISFVTPEFIMCDHWHARFGVNTFHSIRKNLWHRRPIFYGLLFYIITFIIPKQIWNKNNNKNMTLEKESVLPPRVKIPASEGDIDFFVNVQHGCFVVFIWFSIVIVICSIISPVADVVDRIVSFPSN